MSTPPRIELAEPDLTGNEERYLLEAFRSTWISSTGEFVDRFESEFADVCGTREAIAVSNGTVALQLALLTLGVGPGDEVIVPSLTYIATANAVRYVGAEPVFVDVSPDTWCIDPALLEPARTDRTRAVIPVHVYGHPADMDPINDFAAKHGLAVVEDAAEAPYATYKRRRVGGLATMATFSFYGNKILTSGEGGALTLDDPELTQRARLLRGQGMDPARRYFFPVVGHNFRLTNLACALLCAQLERGEQMVARRREIVRHYEQALEAVPGVAPQHRASWAEASPWLFSLTIEPEAYGHTRDELIAELARQGVDTRPFFIPVHSLPPYRAESSRRGTRLPVTDSVAARGLNLPTSSVLETSAAERVAQIVRDFAA
jgi:perosamine synthetase